MTAIIKFCKEWTLPVAIVVGTVCYTSFYNIPQLDTLGTQLGTIFDFIFPQLVFLSLLVTFCKVDFRQMRLQRWHVGILVVQLLLVAVNVIVALGVKEDVELKLLAEAILTCVIGPAAAATAVIVGKLGGNISTMTTYTMISSLVSALLIPLVFPLLEPTTDITFLQTFFIILQKVSYVLLLPLIIGWLLQRYAKAVCLWLAGMPNLSFYIWALTLSIMTGVTIKNIVHSEASLRLLMLIAGCTFILCWIQFGLGRFVGHLLGEKINAGQGLFQKNTALSIWVAYMYLHPVATVGAGCYVLWQNIINSIEIWYHKNATRYRARSKEVDTPGTGVPIL